MRIRHLILTSSFAGAEQHVCVLANEQARHGHRVEVWGGDPAAMRSRLDAAVSHQECSAVATAIWRGWRSPGIDVLHAHMTKGEVAATGTAALHRQSAVVASRHFAAVRGRSRAGGVVRPVLQRRVGTQIAVSKFVAESIDGSAHVVYAGVESQDAVTEVREHVVLVAQRLSPEKKTGQALDAFASSGLAAHGWRLEIAGRGEEGQALSQQAERLGIGDSVRLLGFCDDLGSRLRRAAVLLATPPAEPFGLTVVEAMAHGTPVVASASGGHLESVGRSGYATLYEPGQVEQAGQLLRQLAEDPRRRAAYGADLRRLQQELFTVDRQYVDTQRVYEKALMR